MANQNPHALPADLTRARDRLAAWRRTKQPRSRIPETLWEMAVKLAVKHGVHRTARTLKLDYYSLKKRVLAVEEQPAEKDSPFVELPSVPAPVSECVIELEADAGTLRVHLKGYSATEIGVLPVSVHDGYLRICYRKRLLFPGGRRWRSRIHTPCLQI